MILLSLRNEATQQELTHQASIVLRVLHREPAPLSHDYQRLRPWSRGSSPSRRACALISAQCSFGHVSLGLVILKSVAVTRLGVSGTRCFPRYQEFDDCSG